MPSSPIVARKVMEVATSSLEVATSAPDWNATAYHLGAAMGALAHLAYRILDISGTANDEPAFKAKFLEGFDQGMATAAGVEALVRDPRHELVE